MKISNMAFVLAASIVATPMLTLCKQSKGASALEVIKPHTNILEYPFFYNHFIAIPLKRDVLNQYHGEKIVLYMYPQEHVSNDVYRSEKHISSLKDAAIYKANNIVVWKKNCEFVTIDQLKKDEVNWSRNWGRIFGKNRALGYKCFAMISDNNTKIDIWESKYFMNDRRFYSTSHKGRIAILIDEKGYIVSILDDVKSEKDIFNAFGIGQ